MPLLRRREDQDGTQELASKKGRSSAPAYAIPANEIHIDVSRNGMFPTCANPRCASGWLRLWRNRKAPVFEGGWCCSAECTRERMREAFSRETTLSPSGANGYRHRIPLGLSMLANGWIEKEDLRGALEAQRTAGYGRIGQWLVRKGAVSETNVARALALQWSCPVLDLESYEPEKISALVPRLFIDALGVVPLRVVAKKLLYIAFANRPDPVLAVALERMTGLRVEYGILDESVFRTAAARLLDASYAKAELLEASSPVALLRAATEIIEDAQPLESRFVRVHDFYWLRIWPRRQVHALPQCEEVRDFIFSLPMTSGVN